MEFVKAGLDIGNGYVKGVVKIEDDVQEVNMPSCSMKVKNTGNILPVESTGAIEDTIETMFDHLDMSFDSKMISDGRRRFIGTRAVTMGDYGMEIFKISGNISKAKQELSPVLALSTIAAAVLKHEFAKNHALPEEIEAHVSLAVALPIDEYNDYRSEYKAAYKNGSHIVSVNNFVSPVRIKIVIDNVVVGAEGAAAQYAISEYGEPLYEAMLKTARKYGASLTGLEAKHLCKMTNTVGIDIGEGTVNFPVFTNGQFNTDISTSIAMGYGTVLQDSLGALRKAGHVFKGGRKELAEYLQNKPEADDYFYDDWADVARIVDEQADALVNEIVSKLTDILGSNIQVAYVYGGGASPMRDILYAKLIEATRPYAGTKADFPVLYLGNKYSQNLNREGLFIMADAYQPKEA
jgi:plasmid segregation protein ParM